MGSTQPVLSIIVPPHHAAMAPQPSKQDASLPGCHTQSPPTPAPAGHAQRWGLTFLLGSLQFSTLILTFLHGGQFWGG